MSEVSPVVSKIFNWYDWTVGLGNGIILYIGIQKHKVKEFPCRIEIWKIKIGR